MKIQCPIIHQTCIFVNFGGRPCSDKPKLKDASRCISKIVEMVYDRENEIAALDLIVENYKNNEQSITN